MDKISIVILFVFICFVKLQSCSGVYIANNEVKLFGLSEDFYDYNTFYATIPGSETSYGVIGFGHSGSIQAIINEKGLCYDGYGAPVQELTNTNNLPENNGSFIFEAMTTCETVAEVEALFNQYFHPWLSGSQVFFTDRLGNSAIFEGDTILHKSGDYQICTNFYQSDPESGIPFGFYPCWRYDFMLNELENSTDYSIEFVRGLLDGVHVENQNSPHGPISSVYSLIIDQNANQIYVYNLYNYTIAVVLDIAEELNKERQNMSLDDLFALSIDDKKFETKSFNLNQNYPNPFNPETTIRFTIAEPSHVQLKIFNIEGKLVKNIVDCRRLNGNYSVNWDGTNVSGEKVSSGIYFYKLSSGQFNETKRMLLLK